MSLEFEKSAVKAKKRVPEYRAQARISITLAVKISVS